MKTGEIQIESPPEQEKTTVKEEEHLPPVIIINKGKFSLCRESYRKSSLLYSTQTSIVQEGF